MMTDIETRDTEDEYARLWRPERDNRTLFVTHLTPESATRYQFDITDADEGKCVYSKGDQTTPPRIVVEVLNDNGYSATNLPNISETDPARKAKQIGDAIEWLQKHGGFESGDIRRFAYDRASNVMPTIYFSIVLMDVIGREKFQEQLDAVLEEASQSGYSVTREELLEPRTHSIEFLQNVVFEMKRSLPISTQEDVADESEDRLGITASGDGSLSEDFDTWEETTQAEETHTLEDEALQTLKEEGWL